MTDTIDCQNHGESEITFVCVHLTEHAAGLGFNCGEPSEENPFPDAWCDDCDVIFQQYGDWDDVPEELVTLRIVCSGCYQQCRILNTRLDVSFADLSSLRWKCNSCDEWHYGPCLDFSYYRPVHWREENEEANEVNFFVSGREGLPKNYLDEDMSVIDGEYYFVRGVIELPIIGTREMFRWGVWGSLSKENFEKLLAMNDDPKRVELPPMFSWLSNSIEGYPETVNLKMYAHIQEPGTRPLFELEHADHPLSQEYHGGITPERVREIMSHRLDLPVM